MVKEYFALEIYGVDFYPNKVNVELYNMLTNITIPGQIGVKGRYRGIQTPYGSATLLMHYKNSYKLIDFLNFIKPLVSDLRINGATDISINALFAYKGQCNCELGLDEIKLLHEIKIPFIFSIYEDDELIE